MVVVDLGCGASKRGNIGIDRIAYPNVDIVCNLGFEKIPLSDNSVDKVMAYDFLEHLPAVVCYPILQSGKALKWKTYYPRIFLLREVHRILKPGGIFESSTPHEKSRAWAQDPTHAAPPWTDETWNYFCGGYGTGTKDHPYIDFAFTKVLIEERGCHLFVIVRKDA